MEAELTPFLTISHEIAVLAHTSREGLIGQHTQPIRIVESVAITSICLKRQFESQSCATTRVRFEPEHHAGHYDGGSGVFRPGVSTRPPSQGVKSVLNQC